MHVGAVLGYFGIDFLWRRSVRHQWELRKFRNSKLNTAVLVRESYSSYKKLLEHRQKHERSVASLPRSARKKLT